MEKQNFFKRLGISQSIQEQNYKKYAKASNFEDNLFFNSIFTRFQPQRYISYKIINECKKIGLTTTFMDSYLKNLSVNKILSGTHFTSPLTALNVDDYNNDIKQILDYYVGMVVGDYISYSTLKIGPYMVGSIENHTDINIQLNLRQIIQTDDRIEDIKILNNNTICYSAFNYPETDRKIVFYKYDDESNTYLYDYQIKTEGMPHGFDFSGDEKHMYIGTRNPNKAVIHELDTNNKFSQISYTLLENDPHDWINCTTVRKSDNLVAVSTNSKIIFFRDNMKLYEIQNPNVVKGYFFDNIFFFDNELYVTCHDRFGGYLYLLTPNDENIYSFEKSTIVANKHVHGMYKFANFLILVIDIDPHIYIYSKEGDDIKMVTTITYNIPEIMSHQSMKAVAYDEKKNLLFFGCRFTGIQVFELSGI